MTTLLVTGGSGQLATSLAKAAPHRVRVVGRPAFDFDDTATLDALFNGEAPALVVNAAAWTAVDLAESQPEAAARANASGPGHLAALCARHNTRLIHVSTDYVFDGEKGAPYVETDQVNPTGVYGATKLAGEQAVLAALPGAVILRTAWVYAETGKNFLRTMLNAATRMDRLRVVADQRGTPTNADDLAAAVLTVAEAMLRGDAEGGIYHATGSGETTWHGFATAIFEAAGPRGWKVPAVDAIATADWPTPARRPADSRLDCGKLAGSFGARLPPWQTSLRRAVAAICNNTPACNTPACNTPACNTPAMVS
jgi:dTDP-4-dehydrorhamnose reductase